LVSVWCATKKTFLYDIVGRHHRLLDKEKSVQEFTTENLGTLLADHDSPCISIYQPTHRNHPENQQDPIRYRQLVKQAEQSLEEQYRLEDLDAMIKQLRLLADDADFWNHRTEGLAVLSSPDTLRFVDLQRSVPELVVVADSFHTKPLIRALQSADRYQILCLSRQSARLYEGNRIALDPMDLSNVSEVLIDTLGKATQREEPTKQEDANASMDRVPGGGDQALYEVRSVKSNETDADLLQFFRIIDQAILDYHSRPTGLPLMLAALKEHHTPFREISGNPFLMDDGITTNPASLSHDQLRAKAWQTMEPSYLERLAELTEKYQTAHSRQLGSDDLQQVAEATMLGRVGTLLVEADREIAGKIDKATGKIKPGELSSPELDDVLDDLAEMVLRMNGEVVVVPSEQMPSATGVAALYRF